MRIGIYIPAYNAELTIERVLDRIPKHLLDRVVEILVVDNCSKDNTAEMVLQYRQRNQLSKLHVLRLPENLGYGGSQKIGYRYAMNKFDLVVMLHSDGQYAPEVMEQLIQPLEQEQAEMVFGSRISGSPLKGGMPLHRYLGNLFLTQIQNFMLGSDLSEFHSGYRVYKTEVLRQIPFEALSDDYHFDTEMLILHMRNGARIKEMPIPTHYGDEKNYVNIWSYGIQILVTTGTYFLHRLGLRKSKNWSRILEEDIQVQRDKFLQIFLQRSEFDKKPVVSLNQFNL